MNEKQAWIHIGVQFSESMWINLTFVIKASLKRFANKIVL